MTDTTINMMKLTDRVAIVTGAGSGIGRSTSITLSNWGCKLCLVDRDDNRLNETVKLCKNGGQQNIVKICGDINDENTLKRAVDECIRTHGNLHILVNNAAMFKLGTLMQTQINDFDDIMNTNVRSVILLTKLCVPHLIKTKGCIVNVSSSVSAKCVGALHYSISKAALDRFTKVTALELAEHGIRVNSVNTGHVVTKLWEQSQNWTEQDTKQYLEKIGKLYPLGRCGKPEEISNVIGFLASDCASFITGETLRVDGGLSCTCSIDIDNTMHKKCGELGHGQQGHQCTGIGGRTTGGITGGGQGQGQRRM